MSRRTTSLASSADIIINREIGSKYDIVKAVADSLPSIERLDSTALDNVAIAVSKISDIDTVNEAADIVANLKVTITELGSGEDPTATLNGSTIELGIPAAADGIDGADGNDGVTPVLTVSYDSGTGNMNYSSTTGGNGVVVDLDGLVDERVVANNGVATALGYRDEAEGFSLASKGYRDEIRDTLKPSIETTISQAETAIETDKNNAITAIGVAEAAALVSVSDSTQESRDNVGLAEDYKDLAKKYATNDYNISVVSGEYSSKHYSIVASNHADTAEIQANAATIQATASANSASESATARDEAYTYKGSAYGYMLNTANLLGEFKELWFGAAEFDPSTDPYGHPIQVGATYWNSVENVLKVYNSSGVWSYTTINAATINQLQTDVAAVKNYNQDTVPESPVVGNTWYKSDTGILYRYVNDGTNNVWVAMNSQTIEV